MLIDDANTTLMVLYDTVRYMRRLLTVRNNTEHIQRDTLHTDHLIPVIWTFILVCIQPYLFFLYVSLHPSSIVFNSMGFHNLIAPFPIVSPISLISYPQIPDSANIPPNFPHPDIDPVRRTILNATVTSFWCNDDQYLPSLAMNLTFLCSSVAGYHNDASDDDDAAVAAGKPATEQTVSCYRLPINTASFKPNRINRAFIISCSVLNPAKQVAKLNGYYFLGLGFNFLVHITSVFSSIQIQFCSFALSLTSLFLPNSHILACGAIITRGSLLPFCLSITPPTGHCVSLHSFSFLQPVWIVHLIFFFGNSLSFFLLYRLYI